MRIKAPLVWPCFIARRQFNPTRGNHMRQIVSKASKYLSINNEKGVTAIEYGMLAALIALAIIAAVIVLGGNLNEVFTNLGTQVKAP